MSKKIRGVWASEVDPTPPEKFWNDGFYHGHVNVVAGPSGMMKSTFVNRVVADFSQNIGPAIISNREDGNAITRLRLEAAGAKMKIIRLAEYDLPGDLSQMRADIIAGGFGLLVMDTAAKHIHGNIHRSDDAMARTMNALTHLCEDTGVAIILVEHTLKHTRGFSTPLAAIPDGLARSARIGVLFGADPSDAERRAAVWVKDSYDEPRVGMALSPDVVPIGQDDAYDDDDGNLKGVLRLTIAESEYDVSDPLSVVRVHSGKGEGESAAKKAESAEWLTKTLSEGPVPVQDCYTCPTHGYVKAPDGSCPDPGCSLPLLGISGITTLCGDEGLAWRTIRRAKDAIGVELIAKSGDPSWPGDGRKYRISAWRLPAGHPKLEKNARTDLP